jgi:hydroxypyruvate reductase
MPGPKGSSAIASPELLRRLLDAAIEAAQPRHCIGSHLPQPPAGRLVVVGAGKASAAMAQALEQHWQGPLSGLVITRYGYGVRCRHIEIVEAGHPLPDAAGLAATERLLRLVRGLSAGDLVIALISGGGSSLLAHPLAGLSLADEQAVTSALLQCGAPIAEINCVRRHLSGIKGGRLAAACHPARVVTLAISDVPGDCPYDIASGPTVADPSTSAEALQILRRYRLEVPPRVLAALHEPHSESIKPGDARIARSEFRLIATPEQALRAAARCAEQHGVPALILADRIQGEAREVARVMAAIALQVAVHGEPRPPPLLLLSGGETTVRVRGQGRGGRNSEFALALALSLEGHPAVYAIAADTDGVDGNAEIAGARVSPDSLARAAALGLNPRDALDNNDAHGFFSALEDSVVTGPTFTNVNDFRALLVLAP